MTTIQKFIQNGGYFPQEGGLNINVTKFFEGFIVTQEGVFDKKTFDPIILNNTIDQSVVKESIKINNVINQKFNLGIDRIIDGETETIESIYSISIKYMDLNLNINIEGKESMENTLNNFGLIISFLHQTYQFDGKNKIVNPTRQTVKVGAV